MFSWVLYAHSQFLCSLARFYLANSGVRQTAQSHTFSCSTALIRRDISEPHFAVVNCSDVVMSVLFSLF